MPPKQHNKVELLLFLQNQAYFITAGVLDCHSKMYSQPNHHDMNDNVDINKSK